MDGLKGPLRYFYCSTDKPNLVFCQFIVLQVPRSPLFTSSASLESTSTHKVPVLVLSKLIEVARSPIKRYAIIVQARINSKRLHGKVLKKVNSFGFINA